MKKLRYVIILSGLFLSSILYADVITIVSSDWVSY